MGRIYEEVTFAAPMRVLFWKRWARTCVRQEVDLVKADEAVAMRFELVTSVRRQGAQVRGKKGGREGEAGRPGGGR